jgi:PD-(D/E)XK nuclease superfamily protein
VVEGLVEDEGFEPAMEYGSMFHEAEEAHRKGRPWDVFLKKYRNKLLARYPDSEKDIHKWASICMEQFPLYIKFWETHDDEINRKPLLAEAAFKVPYLLPSGRMVTLRGKFDAVTLLPVPNKNRELAKDQKPQLGIFLQENKTKGKIDEEGILGTVSQNLQTMLYQIALRTIAEKEQFGAIDEVMGRDRTFVDAMLRTPIAGTLYNVIRRPLSDHYAIKQKQGRLDKKTNQRIGAESASQFYERVAQEIRNSFDDPASPQYFMRWRVLLDDADIQRFKTRVFDPILEQLCDWWEWIQVDPFDPWRPRTFGEMIPALKGKKASFDINASNANVRVADDLANTVFNRNPHFQTPWGVYNSMFGGFRGDFFNLLTADRQYGLTTIDNLFPELT